MPQIDISDAKTHLPALLDAAIEGAEIVITENGRPLVKITRIKTDNAAAVSEIDVMTAAGDLLNEHLPDRYCAGSPQFDSESANWLVPVLLSYPIIGILGQVGQIIISSGADKILSFTPLEEMKAAAQALIERNREQIEAPIS